MVEVYLYSYLLIFYYNMFLGWGHSLVASPKCVVRKVNNLADFDKHSVSGLAVEVQSLEKRVETIENAVHAGNLSLQQAGDVLS